MEHISPGARGRAVADVQTRLVALGYSVGPSGSDGVFAQATEDAVRAFQANDHLGASGIVDGPTWRALVDANLALGDRSLYLRRPYMHGDDVRQLQQMLGTLGFTCGTIDAVFGLDTEGAVREFQRSVGLVADGIVGRDTLRAATNLAPALSARDPVPTKDGRAQAVFGRGLTGAPVTVRSDSQFPQTETVVRECAFRLASLLELAGAHVDVRWSSPATDETSATVDAYFVGTGEPHALEVRLSGALADAAQKALVSTLGSRLDREVGPGVESSGESERHPPAVAVGIEGLAPSDIDTFCQRVAVAVFDALSQAAEELPEPSVP